jgi:hypothetical protein
MPSDRAARDHVVAKGACQRADADFPKDKNGRRLPTAWYERFCWIEYSKKTDKAFCFFSHVQSTGENENGIILS